MVGGRGFGRERGAVRAGQWTGIPYTRWTGARTKIAWSQGGGRLWAGGSFPDVFESTGIAKEVAVDRKAAHRLLNVRAGRTSSGTSPDGVSSGA
jgi:hypothetical protein